ncbi:UNVERIFIED_CONTAM: hypothetical protein Q9R58_27930 [Methylobacteriaceae bacterium AG10]|nr:hypothetical protein [Methylobacteriaceae bacterium AG10]
MDFPKESQFSVVKNGVYSSTILASLSEIGKREIHSRHTILKALGFSYVSASTAMSDGKMLPANFTKTLDLRTDRADGVMGSAKADLSRLGYSEAGTMRPQIPAHLTRFSRGNPKCRQHPRGAGDTSRTGGISGQCTVTIERVAFQTKPAALGVMTAVRV